MEYDLRGVEINFILNLVNSLNPYSNGIWSTRLLLGLKSKVSKSLNPYSIGRYSMSMIILRRLIVLLRLNPYSIGRYSMSHRSRYG